jgi:hypothetical protein
MPIEKAPVTLRGSCHCGRLGLEFRTRRNLATIIPRACDCSFCRKHGAAYISDHDASLSISQSEAGALQEYSQGSNTARFVLCRHCGVLVAVVFKHASGVYGAVNAACLDGDADLGQPVTASPQTLSAEEKVSRWLKLWIPDVVLPVSAGPVARVTE